MQGGRPTQEFQTHALRAALNSETLDERYTHPTMNDTKWDEVRLAMYSLDKDAPRWRTCDAKSGYVSDWDREWFYHFREGGYRSIEWVEIEIVSDRQRELVLERLRQVHVPGEETDCGFLVFGHLPVGRAVDYL